MTNHAKLNLIMLVTVVGLAIFLYVKPQFQGIQVYELSSLSADAVQHIHIVHQDTSMTLEKLGNRWYLTEPIHASADKTKVEKLLEILSVKSKDRFSADDLGRFGLDKPNVKLYINYEIFNFGGITPISNEQYVAVGENVYLISPRYAVMLPSQPTDLVSSTLLAETEIPVRFELHNFSIHKHNEEWAINSEVSGQLLSQDEINRWVQLWQQADATNIFFQTDEAGIDRAVSEQKEMKITLRNGQSVHFRIQQNDAELILLRIGEGISYRFLDNLSKQLLDPYHIEPNHVLH